MAVGGKGQEVTAETWLEFLLAYRDNGRNARAAARTAGISYRTAYEALNKKYNKPLYLKAVRTMRELHPQQAMTKEQLSPQAARALDDFAYFRRRYLGRVSMPWATFSANTVAELLDTPHKEYVCINEPPGVGKTTFWTLDLPAWLICRNRAVRIMLGSAIQTNAEQYVQQLRREFERTTPVQAPDILKRKGLAFDADATLLEDFGNFKPARGEKWTTEEFVVVQDRDAAKRNKEPTVRAFGRHGGITGNRVDLAVWDDVVDERNIRSAESREELVKWWPQFAESRLEPDGLMVLQGQRLHAEDLYHTVVGYEVGDYGADEDVWADPIGVRKQYVHVKFKAHYDEHCKGDHHPKNAQPFDPYNPDNTGCLLDPRRLLFRDLMVTRDKDPRLYLVTYQQEDIDPASVLVNPMWVKGGTDPDTGEVYPGCWDEQRVMGQVPRDWTRPLLSYVTVDPSPTKYWSMQWWILHVQTEQRFLIDHFRGKMGANDFLDFIIQTGTWDGLLDEWWLRSKDQKAPITHVVFEENGANRFAKQSNAFTQWLRMRNVSMLAHNTYRNKTDAELGVQALLPQIYRHGLVRLPSGDSVSRGRSMGLVAEATRWPESSTEDCVMAQWFGENQLRNIRAAATAQQDTPQFRVPSWQKNQVWNRRPA